MDGANTKSLQEPGQAGHALDAPAADAPLKPSVPASPPVSDPVKANILAGLLPAAVPAPWSKKTGYWSCYLCGKEKPGQHIAEHLSHTHGVATEKKPLPEHALSYTGLFAVPKGA